MKENVSQKWAVQCFEYNKGIRIGGPFDGTEHSVLFFPDDYPKGYKPTKKFLEVNKTFSKKFPEGAVYHWNEKQGKWHYVSQMPQNSQNEAKKLFGVFDIELPESL